MIISGLVGVPDTMIMVIMVRSMIMHSMAIAMSPPGHGAGRFQAASA